MACGVQQTDMGTQQNNRGFTEALNYVERTMGADIDGNGSIGTPPSPFESALNTVEQFMGRDVNGDGFVGTPRQEMPMFGQGFGQGANMYGQGGQLSNFVPVANNPIGLQMNTATGEVINPNAVMTMGNMPGTGSMAGMTASNYTNIFGLSGGNTMGGMDHSMMGGMDHGMMGMDMSNIPGYGTPYVEMMPGHDFVHHMHMSGQEGLLPPGEQQYSGWSYNPDGTITMSADITAMNVLGLQAFKEETEANPNGTPEEIQAGIAARLTGYNSLGDLSEESLLAINQYYEQNFGYSIEDLDDDVLESHLLHSPLSAGNVDMGGQSLEGLPTSFLQAESIHTIPEGSPEEIAEFIQIDRNPDGTGNITFLSDNNNSNNAHHRHNLITLENVNLGGMSDREAQLEAARLIEGIEDDNTQYGLSPAMANFIAANIPGASAYLFG